ncbi:hypothetical protein K493DRAFT_220145 [Basidiobolus meristosporus CBS 931.73]|uniref:EI24-domain-containing protein n=1 Tax=Basidiobolus meristosporus CBS 931.73 TaxID=1314790 RepID=A0A1Y1YAE3_9FUNG|nr:hypothetical protein K493DRAFT_220145 [Basidiobolus meristosporus CBS 931.73]|eukprot:ORX94980.1 hypothetical protein K493DRAFT_220145 [Basidiobolus meristosporus CBS 931.73]
MTRPKYGYPVQGIFYFLLNPLLWLKCIYALTVTLLVVLCSLLGFGFFLPPQVDSLIQVGCPIWLAWAVGIFLYCLESSVFVFLFSLVSMPIFQDSLFDHVLILRGHKQVLEKEHSGALQRSFRAGVGHIFAQVLLLILSIPVNLIPVIGTYIFCCLNGFALAWSRQMHYHLDLKGMTFTQSKQYAFRYKQQFYRFGVVAFALEMTPLLNFIFIFTNTIGAALWAADEYAKANRADRLPQANEMAINSNLASSTQDLV